MKVFILGPMSGYKGFNFDRLDVAELYLIEMGMMPVNPAHFRREMMQIDPIDYPKGLWSDNPRLSPRRAAQYAAMAIAYDTGEMMKCDAVAVLPEAQGSDHCYTLCGLARAGGKSIIELHPNCIDTTKARAERPDEPESNAAILPMTPPAPQSESA